AFVKQAADDGSDALRVLALGQGAFAVFGIETTVIVSLSRERSSAVLTAAASFFVAALCWALVPSTSFDASLLTRTATATASALAIAAVVGAILVKRAAGSFVQPKTLVRTALAMAAAITVGAFMPWLGRAFVPVAVLAV